MHRVVMGILVVMLVASLLLAIASFIWPRSVLAKGSDPQPLCVWVGCACEEIDPWYPACELGASLYKCCDQLCWQETGGGWYQCL